MEANFCRCLFAEVAERLGRPRVDKIFNPAPGLWTFSLSAPGGGIFLLLRSGRKDPLLFVSGDKPDNPPEPSARCMWFRKRLTGAALVDPVPDWPNRAMAWRVGTSRPESAGKYLVLDLAAGPDVVDALPGGFGAEPDWPDLDRVLADRDVWREHPQITPPLRRSLAEMTRAGAERVYRSVVFGECERFYVYAGDGKGEALPWRLPEALAGRRDERMFDSALEAAEALGGESMYADLSRAAQEPEKKAAEQEERRLLKNIEYAERDLERLASMRDDARRGEIVKSVLHEHGPEERLAEVEGWTPEGERETVRLDPAISLAENMERFFRRGAKGSRGLKYAAARKKKLDRELAALRAGKAPERARKAARNAKGGSRPAGAGYKGMAVQAYVTDDGFTVLRGKNQKANHELLSRGASRHDLWFHARGAPGSHVVLKRDHPGREVPERSLSQAAGVAALFSAYADSDAADVVCALVRDVRKIKGAAHGQVAVDREYASLRVAPDPDLAERLKK